MSRIRGKTKDCVDTQMLEIFSRPNSAFMLQRLKVALQMKVTDGSLDLSGMALLPSDMQCLAFHLQMYRDHLTSIDLSFTELTDQSLQLLLPFLAALPKLTNLALNGNRLTRAVLKDMTEMLKEPRVFPALSWVDLGNNADICSMPQPLLVGLRRRCSLQGALPTIQEYTEGQPNDHEVEQAELLQSQGEEDELHKFREEQAEVHQSWEEQAEVHKSQEEEAEVHQSQEEQAEFHQYREEVGDDNQSREDMGEVYQSQQEGQGVSLSPEQEPGVSRSWENDGSPWQGLRREAGVQRHYQR
ncbi:leucine-rich repeat-containing protein 75A-like isoform X2 [Narcine bancroftii]|uniref:leucine-rich repeat-containing protein 75A-like isoform X2 n=1 Tax=Narcine bancroftii TaxID=1343680 RepID=UPI0038322D3A